MKKKQLQRLKKQIKKNQNSPLRPTPTSYIGQITHYAELFSDFPQIKYLTNNVNDYQSYFYQIIFKISFSNF